MLTTIKGFLRRYFDALFCDFAVPVRRLGSAGSGWYVVDGLLPAGAPVLAGGAGRDIAFEIELAAARGCQVALFDPSPTGVETVARLQPLPEPLRFFPVGLARETGAIRFSPPLNPNEGSYRIPNEQAEVVAFECLSPRDALQRAGFASLALLKIDIEGFEYEFLEAMLAQGIRPAQIAVEFHHFQKNVPLSRTLKALWRLRRAGYRIVHKTRYDYLLARVSAVGQAG